MRDACPPHSPLYTQHQRHHCHHVLHSSESDGGYHSLVDNSGVDPTDVEVGVTDGLGLELVVVAGHDPDVNGGRDLAGEG